MRESGGYRAGLMSNHPKAQSAEFETFNRSREDPLGANVISVDSIPMCVRLAPIIHQAQISSVPHSQS